MRVSVELQGVAGGAENLRQKNRHRASTAQVKALCTMDQLKTIKGFCGKSTVAVLALLKLLNRNFSLDNGGSEARWGDAEMPDEILLHC